MSEYNNENTGVAFQPYEDQKLVGQGKLNINGNENSCVYIKGITKKGDTILRIYQQVGILFQNVNENVKAPQWSGTIHQTNTIGDEKKIAAWKKSSEKTPSYLSLLVTEKESSNNKWKPSDESDTIPI
tara:strand:- start:2501 stop:2884 length:384 start_codon:yes stop_codon:yes gene_type:complete